MSSGRVCKDSGREVGESRRRGAANNLPSAFATRACTSLAARSGASGRTNVVVSWTIPPCLWSARHISSVRVCGDSDRRLLQGGMRGAKSRRGRSPILPPARKWRMSWRNENARSCTHRSRPTLFLHAACGARRRLPQAHYSGERGHVARVGLVGFERNEL